LLKARVRFDGNSRFGQKQSLYDGRLKARQGPIWILFRQLITLFMKDHVYKIIDLVGTSQVGIEDAVNNALQRAAQTVKNMRWFQITETRGEIDRDKVAHWQVTLKIGFTIEDAD